jgi:hypothetical protein
MARRGAWLLFFGAMVVVASVTVLTFQPEVYYFGVDPEPLNVTDGGDRLSSPLSFGELSKKGQEAFVEALEFARESDEQFPRYEITGESNQPPDFGYTSDVSRIYRVQYQGSYYELSTSGEGGNLLFAIVSVPAAVIGLVAFALGLRRARSERVRATALGSLVTVVALILLDLGLPGYAPLLPTLGVRIFTLLTFGGILWFALGAAGVGEEA